MNQGPGHRWAALEHIQDSVRAAGFDSWTILKPAFFMENVPFLMPNGTSGGLVTVISPRTTAAHIRSIRR